MGDPTPDISAIVVTYHSGAWIAGCLSSLQSDAERVLEIVVVDNGSGDDTANVARRAAPEATVLPLDTNRGFAVAANLGARDARGRYLLFLNPDAFLTDGALGQLAQHLDREPTAAATGPRLVHPDGSPQDAAFTYPTLLMTWLEFFPRPGRLLHTRLNGRLQARDGHPIRIDHPLGACMLVRRSAWEEVGPFDEGFFLYCEEVDWCMRAKQRGWGITQVPSAQVVHQGGASAATAPGPSLIHLYTSRRRLHRKHRPRRFRVLARFITCLGLAQERRRLRQPGADTTGERRAAIERALRLSRP